MKSIAVYCGSSSGKDETFQLHAEALGGLMANRGIKLVYGGAKVGLMGCIADAVLEKGGEAIGVLPTFLSSREVAHASLTELFLVDTMHERKEKMFELAEAFIAMPGGYGTMEELFEIVTWSQLGLHHKPIGILNTLGYYNPLIQQIDNMVANGFMRRAIQQLILVGETPEELLEKLNSFKAPRGTKWISDIEQT